MGQHVLQQRSESTISEHVQVVMAFKPKAKPKHFRIKMMEELKGRWPRCGKAPHKAEDYHIFRNKLSCHNCRLEGHISPLCMGGKGQNGPKQTPVNAVTEQEISEASLELRSLINSCQSKVNRSIRTELLISPSRLLFLHRYISHDYSILSG